MLYVIKLYYLSELTIIHQWNLTEYYIIFLKGIGYKGKYLYHSTKKKIFNY